MALALALLALCSCNKAKNISVDNDKMIFAVSGGEKTINVTADGSYDVQDCPDWLQANTQEGMLTLTATANTSGVTRDCVIHLVGADGLSVPIAVVQPDKCTHINVSPSEVTIPKEGGSVDVQIDTDGGNLNVEVSEGINAQYADGKLTVSAPANEGGTKRGTITLTCDAIKTVVNVTVEGSICPTCNGTGKVRCTKCGGKGWYQAGAYNPMYGGPPTYGCERCGGRGGWDGGNYGLDNLHVGSGKMKCPTCGGSGH